MGSLLKIAKGLGMNVKELEETTGYTRQALHDSLNKKTKLKKRRIKVALKWLECFIEEKQEAEFDKLYKTHKEQRENLKTFKEMFM